MLGLRFSIEFTTLGVDREQIFGGFASTPWSDSKDSYEGSGETMVFTVTPPNDVHTYSWSGKNNLFTICTHSYLAFGGG